jgi:ribosomal protein L24E
MLIDNFSQLNFCDVAFQIIDNDKDNLGQLKTLLEAAELVKKYSDHNNGTIYIFCEYLYEEIRRVEKNPKAADYTKYRKEIEQDIARVLGIRRPE